jgi:hypothetical protein
MYLNIVEKKYAMQCFFKFNILINVPSFFQEARSPTTPPSISPQSDSGRRSVPEVNRRSQHDEEEEEEEEEEEVVTRPGLHHHTPVLREDSLMSDRTLSNRSSVSSGKVGS